uniref:Dynamin 1-like protein n=1 Tax=Clandestinovirus TaxID=2831644 RepID=A0A8F8KTU9_9VIRU|nr:dynamin 1-like protein [Clandestinovirus]
MSGKPRFGARPPSVVTPVADKKEEPKQPDVQEDVSTRVEDMSTEPVVLPTPGEKRTISQRDDQTHIDEPVVKKSRTTFDEEAELRYQEEAWNRAVMNKVDDERERVRQEYETFDSDSQNLYTLFHDLQTLTTEYGLEFKAPEIVVVGMQSDGKSTFIEGLLGFQFNIVETNIGTRRPLIIQMVNDPECDVPQCRFKREDENGDPKSEDDDLFEHDTVPVQRLSAELMRRTDKKTGKNKHCVSDSPIVLRVRFAKCANLTIYDTPGFRLGGLESLRQDIENMVLKLIQPEHRIIVCLEQSTIEWANTNSRPFVQRVDPNLERTVVVCTKFDNRVKEMRDADSTNAYLDGEGMPAGVRPFFVSMPVSRNLGNPNKFALVTQDCYLNDYRQLLEVKFDEKRFADRLGFHRVKKYIENLLKKKYMDSLKPTLATLEKWCDDSHRQLMDIEKILSETDVENHIKRSREFVYAFHRLVRESVHGTSIDSTTFGHTLIDERMKSGTFWPIEHLPDYEIPLGRERLLAAAQYKRYCLELEYVLRSVESPKLSTSELAESLAGGWNVDRASSELVKTQVLRVLRPFIPCAIKRACFVLRCLFDPVLKELEKEEPTRPWRIVASCDGFASWIRSVYMSFVDDIESKSISTLVAMFSEFASCLDWDNMLDMEPVPSNQEQKGELKERVQELMQQRLDRQSKRSTLISADGDTTKIQSELLQAVNSEYERKFAVVQEYFIQWLKSMMHAHCLRPIKEGELQRVGIETFFTLSSDRDAFEVMFNASTVDLRKKQDSIREQMEKLVKRKEQFKALCQQMSAV